MGLFFIYSLKTAICLIAFYLVYKLLLSKETFHAFNRVVLLSVIAISIVIPWLKVTTTEQTTLSQGMITLETLITSAEVIEEDASNNLSVIQVLFLIYIIGVVLFFIRELVSVIRLILLMGKGTPVTSNHLAQIGMKEKGIKLLVMKDDLAPFSWFRYVVMSQKDCQDNYREILTHELAHIHLGHSWDIALCNVLIIFQWWNPASWLLKRELQNVHEFEADEAVINRGVDAKQYQMLLIRKSVGERLFSMANNLNHHSLKKRITMMTTKKSNPWQKAKTLVALPLAALAVVAFANPKIEQMAEQVEAESETVFNKAKVKVETDVIPDVSSVGLLETTNDQKKIITVKGDVFGKEDQNPIVGVVVKIRGSKTGTVTDKNGQFYLKDVPVGSWIDVFMIDREIGSLQVTETNASNLHFSIGFDAPISEKSSDGTAYDVVEQMPAFPGGMGALMNWLSMNIKYPKEAYDAKQQGRVIARFIVEKDGSISDIQIVKSVSPSLDTEAVRVLSTMPKWTPGMQNGKPVRVKYTIPVTFKLTSSNEDVGTVAINSANINAIGSFGANNTKPNKEATEKALKLKLKDMIVVVDGKEVPESEVDKYFSPTQIHSITVNKDLKTIKSKYGNAANGKIGAIEITTKK